MYSPASQTSIQDQHFQSLACFRDVVVCHLRHSGQLQLCDPIMCCNFAIEEERAIFGQSIRVVLFGGNSQ